MGSHHRPRGHSVLTIKFGHVGVGNYGRGDDGNGSFDDGDDAMIVVA